MPSPRIERSPLHALRTPVSEQALEGFVLDVMDKVSRGIYPDPRGVSDPIQVTLNSRGALDDTFIPPASRHPFPFGAENRVVRVESENQIIAAGRFGADGVPVVELYTSNSPGSTPPAPPRAAERVAGRSGLFATGPGGRVQVFENGVLIGEQGRSAPKLSHRSLDNRANRRTAVLPRTLSRGPMSASVNVSDFVSRSARYVRAATAAANADGNRYLTTQEAKALPKDLKDNFELIRASGPLTTSKFISLYQRNVSIWAGYVDANKDGALSPVEQRKLPGYIKDNVANYLRSRGSAPAATLKDATRASTIAAHEKAYGKSKVSYAKAFAIAARAIFKDDAGPRWLLTQYQLDDTGSVDKARLERDLKKAIKGLKLLGVGRTNENGDDPKANWIFTADVDDGSDNGYWVSVDRKTGEALVTNFN